MITLAPQLALLALTTSVVGFVMIRLGLGQRVLRPRHSKLRCVACGRLVESRICPNCGRST
jgi:rRNA maturation endonuclease Nob1